MNDEYVGIVKIIQQTGVTGVVIIVAWFLGKMVYKLYEDNKDFRNNQDKRIDEIRTFYETKLESRNAESLSMLEKVLVMVSDNEKTLKETVVGSDKEIITGINNLKTEILAMVKAAQQEIIKEIERKKTQ